MEIYKKVKQKYFEAILDNRKQFEIRLGDFDCAEGDIIVLQEQDDQTNELTGRTMNCEVVYKINTKEAEKFYSKEDIDKHGLVVLNIRRHYDFGN
jgi:hypothetical protein